MFRPKMNKRKDAMTGVLMIRTCHLVLVLVLTQDKKIRRLHIVNIQTRDAYKISVTNSVIGSIEYKKQ